MERYRILDHGGDGKIRAFGATLEEAFGHAALAVTSLMTDWEKVEPRVERAVAAEGRDLGQLLVKFLTEILYLSDAQGFVLGAVAGLKIEVPDTDPIESADTYLIPAPAPNKLNAGDAKSPTATRPGFRLTARFQGDDRPERYAFHGDVKAVTYSELKIESCACGPGAWVVQVVVDL